ncbi:MAG: HDIG domain-containing protein, partial [Planctomycetes bacterium]|nr:HDIG domain-containing protein [Planctomycetota bacterium]
PISNATNLRRGAADLVARSGFAPALGETVAEILVQQMSESPMLLLDKARTNEEMTRHQESVEPVILAYQQGQPFIPARPDNGLTAGDLQQLAEHDKAYRTFLASDDEGAIRLRRSKLFEQAGLACIIGLMTIGLFSYVGMYQRRILEVRPRLVALIIVLLGSLLMARLIDAHWPAQFKELIYAPPLFAASILAIAYSRRFATGVMTIVAIILALSVQGDTAMVVTLLVGLAATVYMLDEIRERTRLIKIGVVSAVALFLASAGFSLRSGQELGFAAIHASWAGFSALLSIVVLQAMLPLIERAFHITTSLTLLEWKDPTRPLLQRLAREAPGTYSHSLMVGDLAEGACSAIGADGLLAQVGALYHDIGKIHKASYFAENQEASINRHDNLAPTMSLLIITGHVKDGVEMAKEYKLPRALHSFIEEHHGTMVVRYFHHIASEKQPRIASGKHDREVPESVFRYPGPKPRSKETAILMLCDGTEGAVRALSEPTPGRIESVVHGILMDRLQDGQFNNCDITLRELHRVEESLVKGLCSLYHGRVAYPKASGKSEGPAESQEEPARKPVAG